jgi:molybdopterin-guanine dinucleotide biosynthesis protein A
MTLTIRDQADLLGLVLLGGESKRMGRAKAYLDYGKGPQWMVCQKLLEAFSLRVYFSVAKPSSLPVPEDRKIKDIFIDPIGPLGGIISAFKQFPSYAWFILACDLPHLDEETARILFFARNPYKKATIYFLDDASEPLCGIYEPSIFADLVLAWSRNIYCPRKIISSLSGEIEAVKLTNVKALSNINYAHEFAMLMGENGAKKLITLLYYASFRHETGLSEERRYTCAQTVYDLFLEIKHLYSLSIKPEAIRFAKNDQLVSPKEIIFDDDVVVFLPPVSGG